MWLTFCKKYLKRSLFHTKFIAETQVLARCYNAKVFYIKKLKRMGLKDSNSEAVAKKYSEK